MLAALVSLPVPGLGHALAGAVGPALAIAAASLACQALFVVVQSAEVVTPVVLYCAGAWIVMAAVASVAVAGDAWRAARRAVALRGRGRWRAAWPVAAVLALNLGLAVLPQSTVAWRSYYAPSGSMLPGLRVGDRFIVQDGWYAAHPVRRGDVVVFTLPPRGVAYVKRVVALGGDRVRMAHGTLVLNGTAVPAEPAGGERLVLALPDGPRYAVLKHGNGGAANDTAEFQVPAGHVFMVGDNMDDSYDSRLNPRMRFVPVADLVGRAAIVYWPFADGRFAMEIR